MKTILITGGSRGIGAATVRRFAGAEDRVYFTYRQSVEEAMELARETGATAIRADAASGEETRSAVEQVIREAGRLDVLVCNAGVSLNRMLMDTSDAEYRRVMDTNVYGVFSAIRAALQDMFWRREGAIVTVSSVWGQSGGSCEAVYSASKAAVIGLTKALAREVAGTGIRVNCVAPGMIDTRMNDAFSREEKEEISGEIPLGRIGTPEEVAETIFFLSGNAASYVTGQVIGVNGGWIT